MYLVVPEKGKRVPNPETNKPVPEKGVLIRRKTTYWINREKDKDVTIQKQSKKQSRKNDINEKNDGGK